MIMQAARTKAAVPSMISIPERILSVFLIPAVPAAVFFLTQAGVFFKNNIVLYVTGDVNMLADPFFPYFMPLPGF